MLYDIDFWDYRTTRKENKDFEFSYHSKILIDYYYYYSIKTLKQNKVWFIKSAINNNNGPLVRVFPKTELIMRNKQHSFLLIRNKSYGFYSLEHFNQFKIQLAYWQT